LAPQGVQNLIVFIRKTQEAHGWNIDLRSNKHFIN